MRQLDDLRCPLQRPVHEDTATADEDDWQWIRAQFHAVYGGFNARMDGIERPLNQRMVEIGDGLRITDLDQAAGHGCIGSRQRGSTEHQSFAG